MRFVRSPLPLVVAGLVIIGIFRAAGQERARAVSPRVEASFGITAAFDPDVARNPTGRDQSWNYFSRRLPQPLIELPPVVDEPLEDPLLSTPTPSPAPSLTPFPTPESTATPNPTPNPTPTAGPSASPTPAGSPPSPSPLPSPPPPVPPAPNPAQTISLPAAPVPAPKVAGPSAAQIQRVIPIVQVWRPGVNAPQVPARYGKYLTPVNVGSGESVSVLLQFNPLASGKTVLVMAGKGIEVESGIEVLQVDASGQCAVSLRLADDASRGAIRFSCEGLTTTLPLQREPLTLGAAENTVSHR